MNDIPTMRTELANDFAVAGAKLLHFTATAGALAAIPETEPQQYAVVGTLESIQNVLPAAALSHPARRIEDRLPTEPLSWEGEDVARPAATSGDAPTDLHESIAGAVARGWCSPENASKVMDSDLALAITREVEAEIARIERAAAPVTASGDELPPLPEPQTREQTCMGWRDYFVADQMQDYARAAVSAATKPAPIDMSELRKLAWTRTGMDENSASTEYFYRAADVQSLIATKPAAQTVPTDYVLMPKRLTGENGAKSLFLGEFKETLRLGCPDCDPDGESCETCGDAGEIEHNVTIGWDTIKRIYALAVEKLAAAPAATPAAQDQADQSHVMPPFAAPASRRGAAGSVLSEDEITELWSSMPGQPNGFLKSFGYWQFARAVEEKVASPCRAQGGNTQADSAGIAHPAASADAVVEIALNEGWTLRREDRDGGTHGWLVYNQFGKLKRGLNRAEAELVDAALRASSGVLRTGEGERNA